MKCCAIWTAINSTPLRLLPIRLRNMMHQEIPESSTSNWKSVRMLAWMEICTEVLVRRLLRLQSGGISLNYGKEKYNNIRRLRLRPQLLLWKTDLTRYFSNSIENSKFVQNSFSKGQYDNHNFGQVPISIFQKHSVSGVIRGNYSLNNNRTVATTNISNTSEAIDSGLRHLNSNKTKWNNLSGTLNYTFKIILQPDRNSLSTATWLITITATTSAHRTILFQWSVTFMGIINRRPAFENWCKVIQSRLCITVENNFKFEAGTKSSYVTTDNDVRYYNYLDNQPVNDTTKSNHFTYKENIHALYTNISGEIKNSDLRPDLRAEQTVAKGEQEIFNQSFTWLHSTLSECFLSYKFSDKYQTKLSYSRRIDRP